MIYEPNQPPPQRLDKKKPEDLPAHPKSIFPAPIGNISSIASMQYFSFAARDEDAQTVQCECMQCALCIVHCALCIVQCACIHCACYKARLLECIHPWIHCYSFHLIWKTNLLLISILLFGGSSFPKFHLISVTLNSFCLSCARF